MALPRCWANHARACGQVRRWKIRVRVLEPELMDAPGLDAGAHLLALRGLARLNALSFSWRSLSREIRRAARSSPGPVRVLDVAGGGGDVLARAMRAAGVPVHAAVVDISATALDRAVQNASRRGFSIEPILLDVTRAPMPPSDIVFSSLFLHHLTEADVVRVLDGMRRAARRTVLINDLRRGTWGLALAGVVPRLVTRSPIVHADACTSVRAAWRTNELRRLFAEAGMASASMRAVFPARLEATWRTS
jgi:ubiquinone/menaquinone biosynthesis C-methylase UbiE